MQKFKFSDIEFRELNRKPIRVCRVVNLHPGLHHNPLFLPLEYGNHRMPYMNKKREQANRSFDKLIESNFLFTLNFHVQICDKYLHRRYQVSSNNIELVLNNSGLNFAIY